MNTRWASRTLSYGFTLVEIMIVVAVIGVLASIAVVGYNGAQKSATSATLRTDLGNTAKLMSASHMRMGAYPDVLPPEAKTSPGITLTLVNHSQGGYSGLTPVQNGVLFQNVCQQLVNEGYGTGTNLANQVEQYITGCHVYNNDAMQINGWNSRNFPVPISQNTIYSWYNANITSDSWRPNKKAVFLAFATELSARYTSLGGVFPVASFWDPWASGSNGGVMNQPLPAPNAPSDPRSYCVEGSHVTYSTAILHITQQGKINDGPCP